MNIIYIWFGLGFVGFILYCTNSKVRPTKLHLLAFSMFTHVMFGVIGLMYGYFTATGLKEKEAVIEDDPDQDNEPEIEKEQYKSEYRAVSSEDNESTSYCSTVYIDCHDLNLIGRDKSFYIVMDQSAPKDVQKHIPIRKGDYHGRKS